MWDSLIPPTKTALHTNGKNITASLNKVKFLNQPNFNDIKCRLVKKLPNKN